MPEMVAPRALVFRPLVKGNEALGTRLETAVRESARNSLDPTSGAQIDVARSRSRLVRDGKLPGGHLTFPREREG